MNLRALVFAAAAFFTLVFFIDLCGLVYQCGCRSLWAGAADHCNIHTPGVRHCPLCAGGLWVSGPVLLSTLAAQAWVVWKLRLPMATRAALALIAFPLVTGGLSVLVGLLAGYWPVWGRL